MNKKVIVPSIIGVLVLTAVAGAAYWENTQQMDSSEETQQLAAVNDDNTTETEPALPKKQAGTYVTYSSTAVASTKGTKLIFFHAPWCSQCRMIEADINAQGVPDGVTVLKADYDSNQDLRKKYGVTLQTTFVRVNDDGSLFKKYVAYNEPTFDNVKRNLL